MSDPDGCVKVHELKEMINEWLNSYIMVSNPYLEDDPDFDWTFLRLRDMRKLQQKVRDRVGL